MPDAKERRRRRTPEAGSSRGCGGWNSQWSVVSGQLPVLRVHDGSVITVSQEQTSIAWREPPLSALATIHRLPLFGSLQRLLTADHWPLNTSHCLSKASALAFPKPF